jgi:hypothetical protein
MKLKDDVAKLEQKAQPVREWIAQNQVAFWAAIAAVIVVGVVAYAMMRVTA